MFLVHVRYLHNSCICLDPAHSGCYYYRGVIREIARIEYKIEQRPIRRTNRGDDARTKCRFSFPYDRFCALILAKLSHFPSMFLPEHHAAMP
jgi:hypothetical protein